MENIREERFAVRAHEVDFTNHLKVSSVFNYMQDAASAHADDINVGWKDLYKNGLLWVLSWVKVEFSGCPSFEDEIKIVTWPKDRYKLYSLRDFLMYDKKGEIFCKGATAWLVLNASTMRITDAKNLPIEIPYRRDMSAMESLPGKQSFNGDTGKEFSREAGYTDLDLNQHVNNAKYIEFITDCFPQEHHIEKRIKNIEVTFISETKYGETIDILIKSDGESNFAELKNRDSGKQVLQAKMEWEKKTNA